MMDPASILDPDPISEQHAKHCHAEQRSRDILRPAADDAVSVCCACI